MNKKETMIKIYSCFPEQEEFSDKDSFLEKLIDLSKEDVGKDQDQSWGGFLGRKYLKDALKERLDSNGYNQYSRLSNDKINKINEVVRSTTKKAQAALPTPQLPLRIFIYPWFPGEKEEVFEGVMGQNTWRNTFHLFVNTGGFSIKSLEETTVHEYNHAIWRNYNIPFKQTILESIVMEGLAEHFRENVVGGEPAPWSTALDKAEAQKELKRIEDNNLLDVKLEDDPEKYWKFHKEIFYGVDDKYKRWTGYSIGYQIVGSFIEKHPDINWEQLMKLDAGEILENADN